MTHQPEQIFLLNDPENQIIYDIAENFATERINLGNVENFSNVCRICAATTQTVKTLFEGEIQSDLVEKIHQYLPIKIIQSDEMPNVICPRCEHWLCVWHEMVQRSIQAEEALRLRIQQLKERPPLLETKNNLDSANVTLDSDKKPRCTYCGETKAEHELEPHLLSEHAHLLFHCAECDRYHDRRQLLAHMSAHAAQYAVGIGGDLSGEHSALLLVAQPPAPTNIESPVFSDRSDDEERFEPLPESVFEAIEDPPTADDALLLASAPTADPPPVQAPPPPLQPQPHPETITLDDTKEDESRKKRSCPVCGKTYTASSSYFYHVKYAHGEVNRPHRCQVCGKSFISRSSLAQHAPLHADEPQFGCTQCERRFRSRAGLYVHTKTHEQEQPQRKHKCECGRTFRWRQQLKRHAARHKDATLSCSHCSKTFHVRADLVRHENTHVSLGIRCTYEHCDAVFAQQRYLRVHLRKKHSHENNNADAANS